MDEPSGDRKGAPRGQLLNPPDTLRRKAPPSRLSAMERVRKAEAAISGLQKDLTGWLASDLAEIGEIARRMAADGRSWTAEVDRLGKLSWDLKNQAASFGFPMVGLIAGSLHGFVVSHPEGSEKTLSTTIAHAKALRLVFEKNLPTTHPMAQTLLRELNAVSARLEKARRR
ncbi:MAG: hypothetical protein RIC93_07630 [Alphaproteobacteria bacterium]